MSIMAFGYLACMDGLHWSTQSLGRWRLKTYGALGVLGAASWVAYFILNDHEIFTALFTVQVIVPAIISYSAAPNHPAFPKRLWWAFLVSILAGKFVWEWERSLFRSGECPESEADPRFWFHPLWHLLSATSHHCWTSYVLTLRLHLARKVD